jgi:hypothetical protein
VPFERADEFASGNIVHSDGVLLLGVVEETVPIFGFDGVNALACPETSAIFVVQPTGGGNVDEAFSVDRNSVD